MVKESGEAVGPQKKTEESFENKDEGKTKGEMQKPAEAVRCTQLNGFAWCTERKYMREGTKVSLTSWSGLSTG